MHICKCMCLCIPVSSSVLLSHGTLAVMVTFHYPLHPRFQRFYYSLFFYKNLNSSSSTFHLCRLFPPFSIFFDLKSGIICLLHGSKDPHVLPQITFILLSDSFDNITWEFA